jgi:DNA-binding transcriptional ArsR family regulator
VSGSAKAALFDAQASVALALGSGRRGVVVDVLAQGERSVEELANEISQSVANTSQHLQVLARAGLVRPRRQGTRIFYRLASERVSELWAAVRDVAVRHVAEVGVDVRPEPSIEPATSRGRARRRSMSFRPCCRNCRGGGRSSPTVAVPTASTPTTPCGFCASAV